MKIKWSWSYIKLKFPKTYKSLLETEELFEEQDFLVDILERAFDYKDLRKFLTKNGIFFSLKPHKKLNIFSNQKRLYWDVYLYKINDEEIIYKERLDFHDNYSYEYVEIKAILEALRVCEYV